MPLYPTQTRSVKGFFKSTITGEKKVLRLLRGARRGVKVGLSKTYLEQYFLTKTVERFAPRGRNPNAQRAPSGIPWKAPKYSTVNRRKANTSGFRQALVDTDKLRNAIDVVKRLPPFVRINGGIGTFSIGVRGAAALYAGVQNFGGTTPKGAPIPARTFMGVSKKDLKKFELTLLENVKKRI
ncbi:MAG: hypothetical protein BMS9Abin11_1014 [Gammaproteobacteria bacterium]|nr:MAG: hypothetical protein BMS9Abin11_1014 [Gammaproteobacteria bacterium]